MRTFKFEACYYEWHLIDADTGETLHNMVDAGEHCFDEAGISLMWEEIELLCKEELISADIAYSEKEEYNGILLNNDKRLDQIEEIPVAAKLIADVLYNYYIK